MGVRKEQISIVKVCHR